MKLEFMVSSKEGGQNFYNRQEEDRITKFAQAFVGLRDVFTEMLVFTFNFSNSIQFCLFLCKTLIDL